MFIIENIEQTWPNCGPQAACAPPIFFVILNFQKFHICSQKTFKMSKHITTDVSMV